MNADYERVWICGQCGGKPCQMGCQTPGWQRYQAQESVILRKYKKCVMCKRESRFWMDIDVNGSKLVRCQECLNKIVRFKN